MFTFSIIDSIESWQCCLRCRQCGRWSFLSTSPPCCEDIDEPIELDELEGTPLSYVYLSAEDSPQVLNAEEEEEDDDDVILVEEASPPINSTKDLEEEEGRKQATTHISVSPDVALASTGEEREKWLAAGKKDNSQGHHRVVTSREDSSQGEGST